MPEIWSAAELAEAFHLACAVNYVVATGLLDDEFRSVEELAGARRLDPVVLGGMLEFLAARTELVDKSKHGFRRGLDLGPGARGLVDQYLGAYGPNATALPDILTGAVDSRSLVDRERHARAF